MKNKVLHKLLNHTGSANSYFFVADPDFVKTEQSKEWYEIQKRFFLHIEEDLTPIFIYKALSILESFPDLLRSLETDDETTYDIFNFVLKEQFNYMVRFLDLGNIKGKLKSTCSTFPIDFHFRLNLVERNIINIITENRSFSVPVKSITEENGITFIDAEWGDSVPIEGRLMFFDIWRQNLFLDFEYIPARLEPEAWLTYITSTSAYYKILLQANAIDMYNLCDTTTEKLAVLLYSLVKSYQ